MASDDQVLLYNSAWRWIKLLLDRHKKNKLVIDQNLIYSIDVNQDILQEQLDQLEKLHEKLTIQVNIQQQIKESLQPNLNSIMEYKTKFLTHKDKKKGYEDVL